jgi:hypothetical protein
MAGDSKKKDVPTINVAGDVKHSNIMAYFSFLH